MPTEPHQERAARVQVDDSMEQHIEHAKKWFGSAGMSSEVLDAIAREGVDGRPIIPPKVRAR